MESSTPIVALNQPGRPRGWLRRNAFPGRKRWGRPQTHCSTAHLPAALRGWARLGPPTWRDGPSGKWTTKLSVARRGAPRA
eukprot:11133700-Lingulodinium_polyedra.AAC.1